MQEQAVECCVCMESDPNEFFQSLCGEHYACIGCLQEMFNRAMRSQSNYPPSCCERRVKLTIGPFEDFFEPSYIAEYRAKEEEYTTPAKLRVYCADPACAAFLPEYGLHEGKHTCFKCCKQTCAECRAQLPTPSSDDAEAPPEHDCPGAPEDKDALDLASKEGYKRCPGCAGLIELRDACNHMNCEYCQADFCFICLAVYPCNNSCPHYGEPEFDEEGYYKDSGFHRLTSLNREGMNRQGTKGPLKYERQAVGAGRAPRQVHPDEDEGMAAIPRELRQEAWEAEMFQLISSGVDINTLQAQHPNVNLLEMFQNQFDDLNAMAAGTWNPHDGQQDGDTDDEEDDPDGEDGEDSEDRDDEENDLAGDEREGEDGEIDGENDEHEPEDPEEDLPKLEDGNEDFPSDHQVDPEDGDASPEDGDYYHEHTEYEAADANAPIYDPHEDSDAEYTNRVGVPDPEYEDDEYDDDDDGLSDPADIDGAEHFQAYQEDEHNGTVNRPLDGGWGPGVGWDDPQGTTDDYTEATAGELDPWSAGDDANAHYVDDYEDDGEDLPELDPIDGNTTHRYVDDYEDEHDEDDYQDDGKDLPELDPIQATHAIDDLPSVATPYADPRAASSSSSYTTPVEDEDEDSEMSDAPDTPVQAPNWGSGSVPAGISGGVFGAFGDAFGGSSGGVSLSGFVGQLSGQQMDDMDEEMDVDTRSESSLASSFFDRLWGGRGTQ